MRLYPLARHYLDMVEISEDLSQPSKTELSVLNKAKADLDNSLNQIKSDVNQDAQIDESELELALGSMMVIIRILDD